MAALVLPASVPVDDDERQDRQLPMFEDNNLLLQTLRDIAAANREAAEANRRTLDLLKQHLDLLRAKLEGNHNSESHLESAERRRYPINQKWRTWRGFVTDMQRLQGLLKPHQRCTKAALAAKGVDSARTITRSMRAYGLEANDWPPSAWDPDEEREYRPK